MTLESINSEIALQMAKYKNAYHKSKIAEGLTRELYQREMDRCTKRLCELLAEKRKIKEA
ncbi:hypothetical protein D2962_09545 [Biomaibacter acetigenes]|uniref:Uncharacterized protein n=1 Tax=Biomaibacter acetigenes TaxID=2316383 RepID=A0A3G2R615_9FIRM|nr:hypothetical protein [Biomaibacter acetigenes]AYO30823.1 hypothetical protein D2962_09545 [Biomaibacter acetigenes]